MGVGPGQPDLLTLQAVRVLTEAEVVFVPVSEGQVGRAEVVVASVVPAERVRRLAFAMTADPDRNLPHWDAAATTIVSETDAGRTVAFATLGDPHVYSTFTHLAAAVRRLRPTLAVETVPGITAMQVLASRSGRHLVDGRERLALVPMLDGPAALEDALAFAHCAVLYKGGRHLGATLARLDQLGLRERAVYGEQMGTAEERVGPASEVESPRGPYMSTLVVWRDGA